MEQQFLTAFNNSNSYTHRKDKKSSHITDFINATYQGHLSSTSQLEGSGTVIDDEFNFILCSSWANSRLNGEVFIKLSHQIAIWGQWRNNAPDGFYSAQAGSYIMYVPHQAGEESRLRRPKQCVIISKGKSKVYTARVDKNRNTEPPSKRQYSIVIEKAKNLTPVSLQEALDEIQLQVQKTRRSPMEYLDYLAEQLGIVSKQQLDNGILISNASSYQDHPQYENHQRNGLTLKLGLLLDKKKLHSKSVGTFLKNNESGHYCLNGVGLAKSTDSQQMMGIFKNDMLVRDFSYDANPQHLHRAYGRNLNGSVVKEKLTHQHMKSLSYQHNYLYFPEIKKIVGLAVQMHKYVDMFERLSQTQAEPSEQESQPEGNKKTNKYSKPESRIVQQIQESSESIIDQYKDFRVVLRKEQFQELQEIYPSNREKPEQPSKKPGFIRKRSPTPKNHSPSPQARSPIRLNKRLHDRTPTRHEQKWRN